ncbi:alpha/beta hydrolase family protein [Leptospira broomii serovar Hurstbridge str. 5399]|uniref:Alpha/beta hydrolase family protein n=1 Tax=Leptospira broomii serovar Hurstbridge str. 5399 TaxID=1049789 RepID=T0F2G6_9LEPT|nr:alpha/beta hydrolase [Leptospira broomii]EQA45320.1 alpha/beta hydrolase family protein [Leptospira broomii serovar Hurstbridge str. 5399]
MNRKKIFEIKKLLLTFLLLLGSCRFLGVGSIPLDELKSKYANSESKFVQIDDLNIHYKDVGNGPVIVLLHGVCSSLHTWDAWNEKLKHKYRVIRLDLPGHGLTGPNSDINKLDLAEAVQTLNKFLKALEIDKFYLVGNSMGGYISWNYALQFPEKVQKLVLIDAAGYAQPLPPMIAFGSHPLVSPFAKHILPKFLIESSVEQVYGDKSKVTREIKDRYSDLSMREGNRKAYNYFFVLAREKFTNPKLSVGINRIKQPTMVMWGTKDEWLTFEYFGNWKQDLPGARFEVYEGAGHIPMEEIPDRTVKDFEDFIASK